MQFYQGFFKVFRRFPQSTVLRFGQRQAETPDVCEEAGALAPYMERFCVRTRMK